MMARKLGVASFMFVLAGQATGCALLGIYSVERVERGMSYEEVKSVMGRPDEEHKHKTTLGYEVEWLYHVNAETCTITFNFDRVLKPPRCQSRQARERIVEMTKTRMDKRKWLDAQAEEQRQWKQANEAWDAQRALAGLPPLLREPAPDSPRDPIPPNLRQSVEAAYPVEDPKARRSLTQMARRAR